MDKTQFLLTKIAEEASELAQAALKAQQFGLNEVTPATSKTNTQRLYEEFNDLIGVLSMLNAHLGEDVILADMDMANSKIEKVERYMHYSAQLGLIDLDEGQ